MDKLKIKVDNEKCHKVYYKNQLSHRRTKGDPKEKEHIKIIKKILKDRKGVRELMNLQGTRGGLNACLQALSTGNTELKTLGLKKAQAEKAYKVKQAEEILKLKAEKYPATLIMELVKGNEEVAELRLQRDVAESAYSNCVSAIDNLRLEIAAITSKLKWISAELKNW